MCEPTTITPEEVIDIICQFYELDIDRLTKRIPETKRHYRTKPYAKGRQFFAYWMRKNTIMSYKKIGEYLDNMDHSTLCHSIDTVLDEMNLYSKYKNEIFTLNQMIQDKETKLELV